MCDCGRGCPAAVRACCPSYRGRDRALLHAVGEAEFLALSRTAATVRQVNDELINGSGSQDSCSAGLARGGGGRTPLLESFTTPSSSPSGSSAKLGAGRDARLHGYLLEQMPYRSPVAVSLQGSALFTSVEATRIHRAGADVQMVGRKPGHLAFPGEFVAGVPNMSRQRFADA